MLQVGGGTDCPVSRSKKLCRNTVSSGMRQLGIDPRCLQDAEFVSTIVSGSGHFQLSGLAVLRYG